MTKTNEEAKKYFYDYVKTLLEERVVELNSGDLKETKAQTDMVEAIAMIDAVFSCINIMLRLEYFHETDNMSTKDLLESHETSIGILETALTCGDKAAMELGDKLEQALASKDLN